MHYLYKRTFVLIFPGLNDLHINQRCKSSTDLSIRKFYKALNISCCKFPKMSNKAFQFKTCECVRNLPEPKKKIMIVCHVKYCSTYSHSTLYIYISILSLWFWTQAVLYLMCWYPADVTESAWYMEKLTPKTSWEMALHLSNICSFFQIHNVNMKSGAFPTLASRLPSLLKSTQLYARSVPSTQTKKKNRTKECCLKIYMNNTNIRIYPVYLWGCGKVVRRDTRREGCLAAFPFLPQQSNP